MKFDLLSNREREILELAAQGKLDKEIVKELGVSINTLRTYWNRIRSKVGDLSRSAFAAAWVSDSIQKGEFNKSMNCPDFNYWWKIDLKKESALLPNFINQRFGLSCGVWHKKESYLPVLDPVRLNVLVAEIIRAVEAGSDHFSVIHLSLRDKTDALRHSFGRIIRDESGAAVALDAHTVDLDDLSKFVEINSGVATRRGEEGGIWLDAFCQELIDVQPHSLKTSFFLWRDVLPKLHPDDRSAFQSAFLQNEGLENSLRIRVIQDRLGYGHFNLQSGLIHKSSQVVGIFAALTAVSWRAAEA